MGRAAKYSEQDILDAALELIADDGAHAATAVAIAKRLGAPSGSIYHRFPSRDLILATLWVRTVQRFQRGFLDALGSPDPQVAAERAVRHTLDWSTEHPTEARLLTRYRREDLIALWPDELGDELRTLNDDVARAVRSFAAAQFERVDAAALGRARFALIDLPYSAARLIIRESAQPAWLTRSVLAASAAVLAADMGTETGTVERPAGDGGAA
ncbi:TetR/AcrR family transcriptional regulator [Agromyces soli]|uniref:TetR/AcrR family transcriptional regulator n=1 Tax=Agromyces soli TaxID=659012 RepID=A0ABY4AVD2_9MICO|nr:TetR/AcrR family transcriptional regulator [Agromyces soli]UOE26774.1 TetR/AcrR family transcriptional regulator [Agromyces soli]